MAREMVQETVDRVAFEAADRTAVRSAGSKLTYGELRAQSDAVARCLIEDGAPRSALVPILTADPTRLVVAILGVLKAGCAFVPLDPRMPAERLRAMVREVEPTWLAASAGELAQLRSLLPESSEARIVGLGQPSGALAEPGLKWPEVDPSSPSPRLDFGPDDLCYVYFTSGSTGRPKGIAGRLKSIGHFVRWEIETLGVDSSFRVSQLTAPTFDAYLRDVFVPLCAGGTLCVPESWDLALDPARAAAWIDAESIHLVHCVPSVLRALLDTDLPARSFSALRYVLLSGERLLPHDVRRCEELFGDRVQLVNLYGSTETTMTKLCYFVQPGDGEKDFIPIGQPMRGARALVVDADGQICPPGVPGEILVRTPFRSLGYFRRPDLTEQVFVPNPFNDDPDDLVFRSGDQARILADGNLEFLGRRDDLVKVHGVRVEIGEIEGRLREHASVRDVAVVARDQEGLGTQLIAYVVVGEGHAPDPGSLRAHCVRWLPEAMTPAIFAFLEKLPRTHSGKVDRRVLPEPEEATVSPGDSDRPLDGVDELLAEIWGDLLGRERVRGQDDFFVLGGHSLLAMRMLTRVNAVFEVDLPLREVFERRTVWALAQAIRDGMAGGNASAPPLERVTGLGDDHPLSFAQERLWFMSRLAPDSSVYNIFSAVRARGALDVAALSAAFDALRRRHESLRAVFVEIEGRPVQRIVPFQPTGSLPIVDLGALEPAHGREEAQRLSDREARRPFDLESGPPLRLTLLRFEPAEHALLVAMPHIVGDAWSVGVILREAVDLYAAFGAGRPSPLAELPVRYVDYALWQRRWLQGAALEAEVDFWRRELDGAPPVLRLPTDHQRPRIPAFRGESCSLKLPTALADQLEALGRGENVTLFMTLLTAYHTLLRDFSGQDDVVVGIDVTGRYLRETEAMIGFFVNQLPIRARLGGNPTFRQLLGRVRGATLAAYSHPHLPFQHLVEALRWKRELGTNPVFQVMFAFADRTHRTFEVPGLELRPMGAETQRARFDLTMYTALGPNGLSVDLEHSRELFEPATISRLLGRFECLLTAVAGNPDVRLEELDLSTEAERRELSEARRRRESVNRRRFKRIQPKLVSVGAGGPPSGD